MASEYFSLRLPADIKEELENLAKATGRSKGFLAKDAIKRYLELESWQIKAIQKGINEAENEETIPFEDIKKEWDAD